MSIYNSNWAVKLDDGDDDDELATSLVLRSDAHNGSICVQVNPICLYIYMRAALFPSTISSPLEPNHTDISRIIDAHFKMTQPQHRRLVTLLIAAAILIHLHTTQATFLELGGGCVFALDTASDTIGEAQLERLDLVDAIATIRSFCDSIMRNSLGGIVIFRVLPQLTSMIAYATNGSLSSDTDLSFFADTVRSVAGSIESSVSFL